MFSILQKRPKRADLYWFIHVNVLSEPYKKEYKVIEIIKDDIYRIDFYLGFREPTKINLMFKQVIKEMVERGEVDITSRYESLSKNHIIGDFKFVLSEKFLSNDSDLTFFERKEKMISSTELSSSLVSDITRPLILLSSSNLVIVKSISLKVLFLNSL
jgi:KUP system potassium uptake protein